jgi:hypothetical protein
MLIISTNIALVAFVINFEIILTPIYLSVESNSDLLWYHGYNVAKK